MVYHQELLEIKMAEILEVIRKSEPLGRSQKLNMDDKIFDVFNALYDMSFDIHHSLGGNDCRSSSISKKDKLTVRNKIYKCIENFYNHNDKRDNFLLMLGFSINLYYVIGMYSVFGKFNINVILHLIEEEDIRNYAKLINEFLHSKIKNGLGSLNLELETNWTELRKKELYRSMKPVDRIYVSEIYMLGKESKFREDSDKYLNKMIEDYPDFRFGWIYYCLEIGIHFYKTKGENAEELYRCKEKVGTQLFWYIIGVEKYPYGTAEGHGRKIFRNNFGTGIPRIEAINKEEYDQESKDVVCKKLGLSVQYKIENIIENICVLVNKDKFKKVRDNITSMLCIDIPISSDKDSLKYTITLFETVERQKKELENKNIDLKRLNKQRMTMMDHLSHSWGNECYPEIIKNVAEELKKDGNHSLAHRLFKAYNSEVNLMGEIIYLQAAMDDESEKLQTVFNESFYISGLGKKEWKIQTIIEDTLEILIFSLLNYDGSKEKKKICQNHLCVKHTLEELADIYSECFVNKTGGESFVNWFSKEIFPITLEIDTVWNSINFGNSNYGKIVMKNILTELFTNMLFHGDSMCEIILESDDNCMYIIIRNAMSIEVKSNGKGLSSIKEIVAKLNYNTLVSEDEGVQYKLINDSIFEIKITFAKELMYIDEDW